MKELSASEMLLRLAARVYFQISNISYAGVGNKLDISKEEFNSD